MSAEVVDDDWARLGIAPTADAGEIRRAYARALKAVNPESDPTGFQALRRSYEAILALQAVQPEDTAQHAAAAEAFVRELTALRFAGDIAGAIAAVDHLFAARRPGDPVLAAVSALLFRTTALQRTLNPALFCHLVDRFDWRDASGPAAQADPKRHSVLLARVSAEDWYKALVADAAQPGAVVAACILAKDGELPLPPGGLDKAQKSDARAVMSALWEQGDFILERFDAQSLAALREAVEGPPLLDAETAAAPVVAPAQAVRKRRTAPMLIAVCVALLIGGGMVVANFLPGMTSTPPTPAESARQVLDQTRGSWVDLRPFSGKTIVYFTQLVTCRAAIAEIRYGLDTSEPDQVFPLPSGPAVWPQPLQQNVAVDIEAPATLQFVSVQIRYVDGSMSAINTYRQGTE